ncbi:hypothetical protein BRAO375_580002 [Bradyrhizobium sp. ORS 375]|nr:hypothetical protein BRAO375_580002 [Bradyrhizobium sp. ORS 375]
MVLPKRSFNINASQRGDVPLNPAAASYETNPTWKLCQSDLLQIKRAAQLSSAALH